MGVGGITEKNPLPPVGVHRQRGNATAKDFPLRPGKEQQAAVRVLGQRHPALGLRLQRFAIPGRNGHPPLGIQRQRRCSLKQARSPGNRRRLASLACRFVSCETVSSRANDRRHSRVNHTKIHFLTLFPTLEEAFWPVKARHGARKGIFLIRTKT